MNELNARPLLGRIADTFASPRRLCAGLKNHSLWFDVLVISTLVVVIAVAAQPADVFLQQMQGAVTRRGAPVEITSGPAEIVRYGRFMAMLSAIVGHPVIAFALAGLLVLIFSVIGRGAGTFRQYLAVVSHALLIPAAGLLLMLIVQTFRDAPPIHGLTILAPTLDRDGFAYALLARISVFQIWAVMVLAVGVEQLDERRSWVRPAVILIVLYLLMEILLAAVA